MSKIINCFNMIEVALAMAIIAFGMTSILGLFPVAINASKNSQVENYSAEAVNAISCLIKSYVQANKASYEQYLCDPTNGIPVVLLRDGQFGSPAKSISEHSKSFIDDYMSGANVYPLLSPDLDGIYKIPMANTNYLSSMYFIVQGPKNTKNIDFSAMVLIWRSPVTTTVGHNDALNDDNWNNWPPSNPFDYMSALNVEISWPLEKPYNDRERRYFYFVISKPIN